MLPLPRTPSKADHGIERVKQSLAAQWGIRFPAREATPSKRDMSRVEEKISVLIQCLYFKEGALDYAINQFKKNASQIISQWQFKPRGEPGVLPSREHNSALKQEFLRKQLELPPDAVTKLTESLQHILSSVADRVKAGETFSTGIIRQDASVATNEVSLTKPDVSERQSSLPQWLRSESESVPSNSEAQHPSSDDYPDHEVVELLANASAIEIPLVVPTEAVYAREADEPAEIEQRSSSEDIFETPPTTPPLESDWRIAPFGTRKRSYPDSMQAPPRRIVFRKISNEQSAQEPTYQHYPKLAGPVPPLERIFITTQTKSQHEDPKLLTQNKSPEWESAMLFGSFGDKTSIAASTPSASSAGTSTNTSFSARSLATSFDSSVDGADTIKAHPWDKPPPPPPLFSVAPETRTLHDPMDVDSEPTVTDRSAFRTEPLDVQGHVEPKTSSKVADELLAVRLHERSPFVQVPDHYPSVPLRQLYEIVRVACACKLDISHFSNCFQSTFASYDSLWSCLSSIAKAYGAVVPERSSLGAWERAGSNFEGVALTGKLNFLDQRKGPCFEFQLNPLKLELSYRLSRQFGSDRFFVLGMPELGPNALPSYLDQHRTSAREAIINWLVDTEHKFLGRTWRAFYTKPDGSNKKKGTRTNTKNSRHRIYLFAEDGVGFRCTEGPGEADPRSLDRYRISVRDMMEWFMPFKANLHQPSLKFFARLTQSVSNTIATVEFLPTEILRAEDARADAPGQWHLSYRRSDEKKRQRNLSKSTAPVMNDGCARISRKAARAIADHLGLDNVPCVFQGRIAGAKGMWMIDALDESPSIGGRNYWIEITDSQLKFEGHAQDDFYPEPARVTFEVNAWAKRLSSSFLNYQLLPILVDRGVPPYVIVNLLDQDLTARVGELEVAMDSGLALRKWNQENYPITEERANYGGIEMQGGLPLSTTERINWFTEHGFEPKTCCYLKDQLYQIIKAYCLRLESKMNIGLGQSTYVYMIADPLAVLEEGQIHLGFSSVFHDPKSGFDQSMLHDLDVLVARSPAHLPSDIQKVRAVFKPELMMYRDVIVFPSRGSVSLASKLSGGDYDGDKAWVCWDPDIVQPFRNADVPPFPHLESYGIEKDTSTVVDVLSHSDYLNVFLRHAFNFNLQSNMLGICTVYHEAYCYHEKAVSSPQAVSIAVLLGNLVDSAKGGFQFDEAKWVAYLKKNKLPRTLSKPAYKDRNAKPTANLIDHLVFVVAKGVRQKALHEFDKRFADVSSRDNDLFRIRNEEFEKAKSNKALANVLKNLETGLKEIHKFYSIHAMAQDADEYARPFKKAAVMTFQNLVERCRADFLTLKPTLDDWHETSDRIDSWQREHVHGRSSYWDLLKASVAFHLYYKSSFVWHMAGIELGEIKATARGRGTYRAVAGEVFEAFKLDKKVVDGARRREALQREGVQRLEEGDEDEFGVWDWGLDDC